MFPDKQKGAPATSRGLRPTLFAGACALLFSAGTGRAQWQTTTYSLKGGWNAIFLTGDAKYDTIDNLFPNSGATAGVTEIWRWNPNPTQVQFTGSPLIPSAGTPEWSVWKRGFPAATTLTTMTGQTSYLVKCAGTAASTYTIPLKQSPLPPGAAWVRNGANLLGFPSFKNGASYPSFSSYFATFPAAIAANTKVFKYVGGDLGPSNPVQVFSPLSEPLDRTQSYWFSAEVVGNFYAPLELSLTTGGGLTFGRTGSVITARVRNRTGAPVTLTLAPVNSETAPLSQTGISGPVPLTRRTFNATTLQWTDTPITAAYTEVLGPQTTVELNFGLNRADPAMTAAATGALFASFLRLTDSGGLMDVYLPASAQKSSLSGLWVGDITLTNVSNHVTNTARATARAVGGSITELQVTGTGGYGYTTAPDVTIAPPPDGPANVTATAVATVAGGAVTALTITGAGSGYAVASPKVTIDPPPPLPGTTTARSFPLRTLLHVADDGTTRLLSQVYLGQLAVAPNDFGICTRESLLKQDAKAGAQRLVAAHLPLDQVISSGSGTVAPGGVLVRTIQVPYNDATNPFIHQYHPDHDNKDPRFNPFVLPGGVTPVTAKLSDGVEAPAITRSCTFTFTLAPPQGSTVTSGWGSRVIGGTYRETIVGVHKQTLQVDGTFELRRASEIGTIMTP